MTEAVFAVLIWVLARQVDARGSNRALRLLPHDEREVVLRADFDELDGDDCCTVSLHFLRGPRHPHPGEWVYLLDCNGRGCTGRVESVHGWTARVRPDWDTWAGRTQPRFARESWRRLHGV